VLDDLGLGAGVGGDDRGAGGQRLQRDVPEGVVQRGQDEEVGGRDQPQDVAVGQAVVVDDAGLGQAHALGADVGRRRRADVVVGRPAQRRDDGRLDGDPLRAQARVGAHERRPALAEEVAPDEQQAQDAGRGRLGIAARRRDRRAQELELVLQRRQLGRAAVLETELAHRVLRHGQDRHAPGLGHLPPQPARQLRDRAVVPQARQVILERQHVRAAGEDRYRVERVDRVVARIDRQRERAGPLAQQPLLRRPRPAHELGVALAQLDDER